MTSPTLVPLGLGTYLHIRNQSTPQQRKVLTTEHQPNNQNERRQGIDFTALLPSLARYLALFSSTQLPTTDIRYLLTYVFPGLRVQTPRDRYLRRCSLMGGNQGQ